MTHRGHFWPEWRHVFPSCRVTDCCIRNVDFAMGWRGTPLTARLRHALEDERAAWVRWTVLASAFGFLLGRAL